MQTLKIVLGSAAFFLCLWLTTGLLGDTLLGSITQQCVREARASSLRAHQIRAEDVLEAVCLVNGEAGFSAFLPGSSGFRPSPADSSTRPSRIATAG